MATDKFTTEQMIEAAYKSMGMVPGIANQLRCSSQTVRNYARKYVTVQKAIQDARQDVVDLAEVEFIRKIKGGDTTCIIYALKTLGKDRGYVERNEITGKDGATITFEIARRKGENVQEN